MFHSLFLHLTYCIGFKSNGYNFLEKLNHCSAFFAPCFLIFSNVLIDFHMHDMIALPISLLIPIASHIKPPPQLCLLAIALQSWLIQCLKSILVIFSSKNYFVGVKPTCQNPYGSCNT